MTAMEKQKMLTKIALVAALAIGTAGAALAAQDSDSYGGFRELGPGGVVTDGVNPVFHPSLRARAGSAYGYAPGHAPQYTEHKTK